jgi:hypothetical protein
MSERQQIFALNVSRLILYIFTGGYKCTLGEVYRPSEMAKIYAKQGKGIINSQHCVRLAIDLNLFSPSGEYEKKTEAYFQFGKYWESLHPDNRWGGHFGDGNHFEMKERV